MIVTAASSAIAKAAATFVVDFAVIVFTLLASKSSTLAAKSTNSLASALLSVVLNVITSPPSTSLIAFKLP